jgi:hypothetical protein
MRRLLYAVAAVLALAPLAAIAPASAAVTHPATTTIQPDNAPCNCNVSYADPQDNTSQHTQINGGFLYTSATSTTTFQYRSNGELEINSGPYAGDCLWYNSPGSNFKAEGCNGSRPSDLWEFGNSSSTFSEWQTQFDLNLCAWFNGASQEVVAKACDGMSSLDRWNWNAT